MSSSPSIEDMESAEAAAKYGKPVQGPTPPTPPKRILQGSTCYLMPLNSGNMPSLYEAICEPRDACDQLWDYMPEGPFSNLIAFTDHFAPLLSSPQHSYYTIVSADCDVLGMVAFVDINVEHRSLELDVLFSPQLQKSTSATEAVYLLLKYAFELGYCRVLWKCNNFNEPSKRAARRLGFVYEGTMRKHQIDKNRHRDSAHFSIVLEDWPHVRHSLEEWLSENNFDSSGQQLRRLRELRLSGDHVPMEIPLQPDKQFGALVLGRKPRRPVYLHLRGRLCSCLLFLSYHVENLYGCICTPYEDTVKIWDYIPDGPYKSSDEFRELLYHRIRDSMSKTQYYCVSSPVTGNLSGMIAYLDINREHRTIEIGYVVFSPGLQHTTASTEAVYLMVRHAFASGYHRVLWKCNALNKPSWRAAERLGFRYEGTLRRHLIAKERHRDSAIFSIVKEEWPLVKGALEKWLHKSNFDEQGKQIRGLVEIREDAANWFKPEDNIAMEVEGTTGSGKGKGDQKRP